MEIEKITGIGPKTSKLLNKLNIFTDIDLLSYYPYRYNIYNFNELSDVNDTLILNGVIESLPVVYYIKKNLNKLQFRCNINNVIVTCVIFNRAFLKQNLTIGKNITLIGKYDKNKNYLTLSDIKFNITNGYIESVYHLTNGITNNFISKTIKSIIDSTIIYDTLPIKYQYNFISKNDAIKKIHLPNNAKDIKEAKIRLIYEELFEFSFKMNFLNKENKTIKGIIRNVDDDKINGFIASLPFELTVDQLKAVNEIIDDFKSDRKMNRLLLGDVGSGKTIVAIIAIYANYLSGYQTALMAPTEILATQHYYNIKKLLEPFNVSVEVITGSMSKKEKEAIYRRVKDKEIDLLIGTHSLLSDNLIFDNLGLVITDEQHRFGVNQRSILKDKTIIPDILYLSATPIPRTYAMTIYGDLDISMIKTKPSGRKDIITQVKKESEIKEVLQLMLDEVKKGHQVYIVSPLVEQNDDNDLSSVKLLKEKMDIAYKGLIRTEIIHGKMKQAEKDFIMEEFKEGRIKILISTTVIEVGIDVKNATTMVIFNAERFGLASLHQLRGRVGRNELQSYCILISNYENERLKVMEESNDGFYISQKDFEIRGHGDLFGTRQSGDMHFLIADLKRDYDILVQAKNDAQKFIDNNEYLDNKYYLELSKDLNITD